MVGRGLPAGIDRMRLEENGKRAGQIADRKGGKTERLGYVVVSRETPMPEGAARAGHRWRWETV